MDDDYEAGDDFGGDDYEPAEEDIEPDVQQDEQQDPVEVTFLPD